MLIKDLSKNCTISESSFVQNLQSYSVSNDKIQWIPSNTDSPLSFRFDIFNNGVSANTHWTPFFITNDERITNKVISHYGSLLNDTPFESGRLGIEDFIEFEPQFKNWTTNGKMTIDWILNRSRAQYSIYAGILYWSKSTIPITGTIDKFPIYSKLVYNNIIYLKIDDINLKRLSNDITYQSEFNNVGEPVFNYDNNEYTRVSIIDPNNINPTFTLYNSAKKQIWIPDGDQILYYLNNADKILNESKPNGLRSYVSGSLYKYYSNIYNAITANNPLNTLEGAHLNRLAKKLAHTLSTSPFIGEFFVSILSSPKSSLKDIIHNYIFNTSPLDLTTDIQKLKDTVDEISKELSQYEIQDNNVITNNTQLFNKLLNKYGAKLKLSGNDAILLYTDSLKYGDSIIVEEIGDTLIPKTLKNTTVTNNKEILLNKLSIKTNLSETVGNIELKVDNETKNTVHLYNHVKPETPKNKESNIAIALYRNSNIEAGGSILGSNKLYDYNNYIFYWGRKIQNSMDDWLNYCPKLMAVNLSVEKKYEDPVFPDQNYNFLINEFNCVWEKVSGPPMKLVDLNKIQTNKQYNRAYGNEVVIVPSTTGRYTIKCTISSPFGSYTQIKVLYVVDGRNSLLGQPQKLTYGTYASENNPDPDLFNLVFNSKDRSSYYTLFTQNIPIPINKDNLKVFISDLTSIAIDRKGLFIPINTSYYVEKLTQNRPIERLNDVNYKFMFDENKYIEPVLQNSILTIKYYLSNTIVKLDRVILRNLRNETDVECSQCYSPYNPKFRSYIGASKKPSFTRSNKYPDIFSIQRYIYDGPTQSYKRFATIDYKYPKISTDFSPSIATYGGYGNKILDSIAVSDIPNHGKPNQSPINAGFLAKKPTLLPPATGYKLNYKDDLITFDDTARDYKFCYQKTVMPSGFIEFTKGTFIPDSGFCIGDDRNLSSVLKFNPGARKSFNFTGPGILGLSNSYDDHEPRDNLEYLNNIKPNIFTSSIELNINPNIQWDTGPGFGGKCLPPGDEAKLNLKASAKGRHFIRNQINKELADQLIQGSNDYHHGYRILNGGYPKAVERNALSDSTPQNDEFNTAINQDLNRFIYSFNVVGPNNPITPYPSAIADYINDPSIEPGSTGKSLELREFIEKSGSAWGLRDPRINNLQIKDIEVKLNFLNYVNTKDLIIWLDVEFCNSEQKKVEPKCPSSGPCTVPPQILADNIFVDQFFSANTHKPFADVINAFEKSDDVDIQNNNLNDFLTRLTNHNSLNSTGALRLYLLNQEIIQNKEYNFSVTFSDIADKNNVLFDHNSFSRSGILEDNNIGQVGSLNPYQKIVSNNQYIKPTTFIPSLNTKENCYFSNLVKQHSLIINNNTFNKFANRSLFIGINDNPDCPPLFNPYDSSTKFTLNIAVLNEEDEMFPLDTLINNELYTNIASVDNRITSANLFNNLCSWELILHTEDVKKPVSSSLNPLTNYGSSDCLSSIEYGENPKYPGYNFIADLSDKRFLLPLVNMNAPHVFFQNYNLCEYADSELVGKGALINTPRFPTEAILLVLAGTAVGGMTGTLVGVLVGGLGASYYAGFQLLFDYFREARAVPLLEFAQRETFEIDYDGYAFGNSDKILINASKDGCFWYKMEASIFKLNNTPALPLKQYSFIKSNSSNLFKFDFNIIKQRSDLIDGIFVPYIKEQFISLNDTPEEDHSQLDNVDNAIYNDFNFLNNNILVSYNNFFCDQGAASVFQSLKNNKVLISINNSIAYRLFDISDIVNFTCDKVSAKVEAKALIFKDNIYQTILALDLVDDTSLRECSGQVLLPDNVIALYDSNYVSQEDIEVSPVSLYGLVNNTLPDNNIPIDSYSTFSAGSYGDGSNIIRKNILSHKIRLNNIKQITDTFNNFINDKSYFNKIKLKFNSNGKDRNISIASKFEAYPVFYTDERIETADNIYHFYDKEFDNTNIQTTDQTIDELSDAIKNMNLKKNYGHTYKKDLKYNLMYLKIRPTFSSLIHLLGTPINQDILGTISIENNYSYNTTLRALTNRELIKLKNRLKILNATQNTDLDSKIGNPIETNVILSSDSIFYIQSHYDLLDDNSIDCSAIPPNCHKTKSKNKLQQLYTERHEILTLLESQLVKKNEEYDTFKDDQERYGFGINQIIPEQDFLITTNPDQSLNINYMNISDKYYWINIDPKQSCSLAEELRPRVLKSAKYSCESTNPVSSAVGGVPVLDFNNICPKTTKLSGKTGPSVDFTFDAKSSPWNTVYTTKEESIQEYKKNLEKTHPNCIYGWKEQTIERKFRIHPDESIDGVLNNIELLVTVTETYDVAMTQYEWTIKQWSEAGLDEKEIKDLLIEENIIKNDYSGDIANNGLLNGLSPGSKYSKPTRVYNIFNLDDISTLKVQFRKAPRMIRGIDFIGSVLRYGENNAYKPLNRPPLDPLDMWGIGRTESLINNFYYWECFQQNPVTQNIIPAQTPELFKLMNEMWFRAFFGSVDNIEHKTERLKSLYDWEAIPFEYFTRPQDPPEEP